MQRHLDDLLHYLDMGIPFEMALDIIKERIAREEEDLLADLHHEKYPYDL